MLAENQSYCFNTMQCIKKKKLIVDYVEASLGRSQKNFSSAHKYATYIFMSLFSSPEQPLKINLPFVLAVKLLLKPDHIHTHKVTIDDTTFCLHILQM